MGYTRTRCVWHEEQWAPAESTRPALSPYVNAVLRSIQQQWKQMFIPSGVLTQVLSAAGPAVALGYVAGLADNPTAVSYVFVGAALSATWTMGVFRTGWSMAVEHSLGTLDLLMTTRTPVALIMLGKALGITTFVAIGGVVAFPIVLGVSRQTPAVDNAALFLVSCCVALVAVIALCFVFSPLSFLVGVRGGFFNALMPFGTIVSGFLYPIDVLPRSLEAVARLLPTAWAMQAVVDSIEGGASSATILLHLTVALALSAALITLACLLFVEAERRVRLSGNLGSI